MRVGVLIIGSLLWDDREVRARWRDARLDVSQKVPVSVPICYGRLSGWRRDRYTMVIDNSCPLGRAYLVPTQLQPQTGETLVEEALALSRAEQNKAHDDARVAVLCNHWLAIGLLVRPGGVDLPVLERWREAVSSDAFDAFANAVGVMKPDGTLDAQWPTAHPFDAALVACNRPNVRPPTAAAVAKRMITDRSGRARAYFENNREHGIETYQDESILAELRKLESATGQLR